MESNFIDDGTPDLTQLINVHRSKRPSNKVTVPLLKEALYDDTIDKTYLILRRNRIGGTEIREADECISLMHLTIHIAGECLTR